MHFRPAWAATLGCLMAAGCGRRPGPDPSASTANSGQSTATLAPDSVSVQRGGRSGATGGVPPGYLGRTDDSTKSISGVSYTAVGDGMWEVESGSHDQNLSHIMYSPRDTARGVYTVHTEIDQVAGPMHPEAAGVFIGGRDLAGPDQTYAYFLVRADGQYSIKLRRGPKASILVPFTSSSGVPKADAAGHASYAIAVAVTADSVRLQVNGQRVAAVSRSGIPTDGIVGVRVNHGLHLMVKPLVIGP